MSYSNTWNDSTPLGSAAANTIDDIFRALKIDIEQRLSDLHGIADFTTDPLKSQYIRVGYGTSTKGGYVAYTDDTGTARWTSGLLSNFASAKDFVIQDIVNARVSFSVNATSGRVGVSLGLDATVASGFNGSLFVAGITSVTNGFQVLSDASNNIQVRFTDKTGTTRWGVSNLGSSYFVPGSDTTTLLPGQARIDYSSPLVRFQYGSDNSGYGFAITKNVSGSVTTLLAVNDDNITTTVRAIINATVANDYALNLIQYSVTGFGLFIKTASDTRAALNIGNAAGNANPIQVFGSGNIVQSAGYTDLQGLRVAGANVASTGAGVEVLYSSNIGTVQAYDRNGGVYKQLDIGGLIVNLKYNTTTKIAIGSASVALSDYLTIGAYAGAGLATGDLAVRRTASSGFIYFGDAAANFGYNGTALVGSVPISNASLIATTSATVQHLLGGGSTPNLSNQLAGASPTIAGKDTAFTFTFTVPSGGITIGTKLADITFNTAFTTTPVVVPYLSAAAPVAINPSTTGMSIFAPTIGAGLAGNSYTTSFHVIGY